MHLSPLWCLRLGVGFLGFVAAVSLVPGLLAGSDPVVIFGLFVPPLALATIIAIELIRALVLVARFIGCKTGLLSHAR